MRTLLALAAVLIAGCAHQQPPAEPAAQVGLTYAGEIPCADCPGQQITLTLFPDYTYRLRLTFLAAAGGSNRQHYELGRWARAQDGGSLRLRSGTRVVRLFRFVPGDRLRMLDREGSEIRSPHNYELARQAAVDPVAGPMRLRGMYAYTAGGAQFTECLSGKRFPVALERGQADLGKAYLAQRRQPGDLILATLSGSFAERRPDAGAASREHLIVVQFERLLPGETCARRAATRQIVKSDFTL